MEMVNGGRITPSGGRTGHQHGDYAALTHTHAEIPSQDNLLWDDLKVSLARATTGTNNPTYTTFVNTTMAYFFSPTTMQQLHFDVQLPHSWAAGTDIMPHIHFAKGSVNTGVIRWGLEFAWANIGGDFTVYTDTIYGEYTVDSSGYQHLICPLGTIDGLGMEVSSVMACRIFRDATDPADTFPNSAWGLSVDFHIQQDSVGSTTEYGTPEQPQQN
jgi:hypothetical protein